MADMLKFYKGLVANLPESGASGGLYITTDEGAIYLGTGTGMKRLGDFIQVANVAALPTAGAHQNCMYYCVAENILAKWNGTTWTQINKQPTAEEMKTLLGLGSMAYVSEVAEDNLSTALKEKVNAASEGNHSHLNKALLDTYTQTEADLADAVAKKHSHANATELAKIADGDKAKWDAVVDDHLTSADKTALETSIKEAKKAGTDANTALETYKVSNDARVKAVEDDIADINNETSGILAQAKTYADGKDTAIAAAKTAGENAQSAIDEYKTSNDSALAAVKATADAAAVKTEVNTALAGKVDKVEGKSLISDTEIERLATVTNYDDADIKASIAKKADSDTMTTELGKKVDKATGKSLIADTEIARLAAMSDGANKVEDSDTNGSIKIDGVETVVYTHPTAHAISEITGLQAALDGKQAAGDYATKAEAQAMADAKDTAIQAAKDAADAAQADIDAFLAAAETGDAAIDTLKELQDYIDTHGKAASTLTTKVGTLETTVGKAAEGENPATGLVKDVADNAAAIVAERTRAEGKESELAAADATNLQTAQGYATTAESNAKTYADGLAKNYDANGAAATAETNAKAHAESLLVWGEF